MSEYTSLENILSRGEKISPRVLYKLLHPLVERLIEIRDNGDGDSQGRLSTRSILFTNNCKNIDVMSASTSEQLNIKDWGEIILQVIDHAGYTDKRLAALATSCVAGQVDSLEQLHLMLERRVNHSIYILLIIIVVAGLAIMAIMNFLQ